MLGNNAEDDQRNAGRDENTQRSHYGDDAGGELLAISVAIHFRHGHHGKRCRRSRGRSANGLEGRGAGHRCHSQPAGNMPNEFVGGVEQPAGNAGIKSDLAHEHKEGDNRKSVRGKDIENILGQKIGGGAERYDITESQETDEGHGKSQLDARKKKQ